MFLLCYRNLQRRGLSSNEIKEIIKNGFDDWLKINSDNASHKDENTWHLKMCTRQEAEALLANKPTGTFLIRPSSSGDYALSIACNGVTNHCIIYETETGFFGFAIPYSIHDSLKSLVLHYAQSSLEEHNDLLQTELKYPVLSNYIKNLPNN